MVGLRPLGSSRVDHYMLRVRIKMRLGGCAACSEDTDADRGWG
jgi:hypothetical protein